MTDRDVFNELQVIAARALPGSGRVDIQKTESGNSTPVYRVRRNGVTRFLRLAEGPDANLAPEVHVHELLRSLGVRVPEVVHFEPFNHVLERSVMVTTEIPGESLRSVHQDIDISKVLEAAGRDLAVINSLEVSGFGWIRRDRFTVSSLEAELPTLQEFATGYLESHPAQLAELLTSAELSALRNVVVNNNNLLASDQAFLAHGDFDLSHIFHLNGEYTGIIDFGEIRGASRFYDLGHFALHDGEAVSCRLLPFLLDGYRACAGLPPDFEQHIHLWSLLIGIRALARSAGRPKSSYQDHLLMAVRRALREPAI